MIGLIAVNSILHRAGNEAKKVPGALGRLRQAWRDNKNIRTATKVLAVPFVVGFPVISLAAALVTAASEEQDPSLVEIHRKLCLEGKTMEGQPAGKGARISACLVLPGEQLGQSLKMNR